MQNLLAVYDLTNYASFSALGIALSLVAAGVILLATILVYRKSVAREKRAEAAAVETTSFAAAEAVAAAPPIVTTDETQEAPIAAESESEFALAEEETLADKETPALEETSVDEEAISLETPADEEIAGSGDVGAEEEPMAEIAAAVAEQTVDVSPPATVAPPLDDEPTETTPQEKTTPEEEKAEIACEEPAPDVIPAFIEDIAAAMPEDARRAFTDIVVENSESIKSRISPLCTYEEENDFLRDFFRSIAKYKKLLPSTATEVLYERACAYTKSDVERTRLNNKMIGAFYARRKDETDALAKCEELCREDVELNLTVRKVGDRKVPSVKRLILIYASRKDYEDAIALCDRAIIHGLIDRKGEGYDARREKLNARFEKQKERIARQKEREERARLKRVKAEAKDNFAKVSEVNNEE